jgi:hypothetical protein
MTHFPKEQISSMIDTSFWNEFLGKKFGKCSTSLLEISLTLKIKEKYV